MHRKSLLLALMLAALGTVLSVPLAGATSTCDVKLRSAHYGTLQAAVHAASPGDKLKVRGTCYGDTTISKHLTVIGQSNPGFGPATLNGANNATTPGSVVIVNEGVTVTITGLSITGGEASFGGGILNRGALRLKDSTVTGNGASVGGGIGNQGSLTLSNSIVTANGAHGGGGIWNEGSLTLTNSAVTDNEAEGGGGISNGGSLTVTSSSVSGNESRIGEGGGIWNYGLLTLTDSTVTDNNGADGSGGIKNGGSATIKDSSIADNRACGCGGGFGPGRGHGAGVNNEGSLTVIDSMVTGNRGNGNGGGIENSTDGSLTVTSSTISQNQAVAGGGLYSEGSATLTNSNVAENVVTRNEDFGFGGDGGGIYNARLLTLDGSSSVTGNTADDHGGGIYNLASQGATITYGVGWTGTVSGNTPDDIFNF